MSLFKSLFLPAFLILINLSSFAQNANFYPGKVIVKFRPQFRSELPGNLNQLNGLSELKSLKGLSFSQKFPHSLKAEAKASSGFVDLSLIYLVTFSEETNVEKIISQLSQTGLFEYTEPLYKREILFQPNDPGIISQYHHALVKVFEAFNVEQGDTNIVIGITDTGTDLGHPDLKGNIKFNYNDPIDGVDNDLDGYVDNFMGWDLGSGDNNPQYDTQVHGVHVQGIPSAQTNNNVGIAGVGYKCKVLPVKIIDATNNLSSAYDGIVYAADHGCSIINCSWGGQGHSLYEQDIVNYAVLTRNCVLIASAGNNNDENLFYPASYNNVISVAATDSADAKWSGSTYNYKVDVSAPGRRIYSTLGNASYGLSSGTSMAGPLVAGCAAIVKSHFPHYNALQIGEQLRVTTDYIDTVNNPQYANKLGSGRVNLYKALTDTSKPSIRLESYQITDKNDLLFSSNDTLYITADFKNYLAPSVGTVASISTNSNYISVIYPVANLGSIATLETKSNATAPFKLKINGNVPINHKFLITISYAAVGYTAKESIEVTVNEDYLNIVTPEVTASISSNGRFGYNDQYRSRGVGIKYKGSNLLFESSFMAGGSAFQVSDNLLGELTGTYDVDLITEQRVFNIPQSSLLHQKLVSEFNDDGAGGSSLNINVKQTTYCYNESDKSRFFIVNYQIVNTGNTPVGSAYFGVYNDWDILNADLNRAGYNGPGHLVYARSSQPGSPFAGMVLLNHQDKFNYYLIDQVAGGKGGADLTNGFSPAEKFTVLSTKRSESGVTNAGNDVAAVISTGPYFIGTADTVTIAFAYVFGDSLPGILEEAGKAQDFYNLNFVGVNTIENSFPIKFWPNPTANSVFVATEDKTPMFVEIYNTLGVKVMQQPLLPGKTAELDLSGLASGLYQLRLVDLLSGTYVKKTAPLVVVK